MTAADPIHLTLERFHANNRGELEGGFDALLHPDVVFYSPVVFTPQEGRDITKLYLAAAGGSLGGDEEKPSGAASSDVPTPSAGGFRYTKEILDGHHAVLEFETSIEGKYVNGIDMMTCDDDGMITEFKVMVRPLQGVNAIHQAMMTMLERMQS